MTQETSIFIHFQIFLSSVSFSANSFMASTAADTEDDSMADRRRNEKSARCCGQTHEKLLEIRMLPRKNPKFMGVDFSQDFSSSVDLHEIDQKMMRSSQHMGYLGRRVILILAQSWNGDWNGTCSSGIAGISQFSHHLKNTKPLFGSNLSILEYLGLD